VPRVDTEMAQTVISFQYYTAGTKYTIVTPTGVMYSVYSGATYPAFKKSTDGGLSWSEFTLITATNNVRQWSVWYDRWSGIGAGLIHIAYTDNLAVVRYRTIDTEAADALSTEVVVFTGVSQVSAGSSMSIVRARGGNVYCRICVDNGVEGGFFRLLNADVPAGAWAARTNNEALAIYDQIILTPGFAADAQDIIGFFWDSSANGISRQIYDDSADTWAETAIVADGSAFDTTPVTGFPHYAATVDLVNSRIILAAWIGAVGAADGANNDLRLWFIDESAITESAANVVLNSGDDQGLVGVGLDLLTTDIYVVYGGKSDGSETWPTALNLYYKVTPDDGATWSAEQQLTLSSANIVWLACPPNFSGTGQFAVHWYKIAGGLYFIRCNAPIPPMPASLAAQGFQRL